MRFLRKLVFLLFALLRYRSSLNVSCQDPNDKNHVIVETTSGKIRGQTILAPNSQEIVRFLGVPFGQAPLGDLRFKLPRKVEPWTGVFDADRLASACYQWKDNTFPGFEEFQFHTGTEIWNANTPMTEDCLNLNIWAPRNVRNVSVMVWIYGGGFIYGSPSLELYDGEVLAAEGQVIVVNVNYRTGPFGFLYFDQESQHDLAPGNMGLADQQLALR
uniref:Acetylcholinesterase n=1 Tax=Romanomermis culicivorax TaxID=13658 RepID=A0A915KHU8_ROMCU